MSSSNETVVDGVHRLGPTGISILIVGAGVGGMMTALESWRQGHDVRILERNPKLDTIGDCFSILPPAWTTLRFFPKMKEQFERESYDIEWSFWRYEGRRIIHLGEAEWNRPGALHQAKDVRVPWIETRSSVADMLARQCERLGIRIEYGNTAVAYGEDEREGVVTVARPDGSISKETADIVVAADGVATTSHEHVTGRKVRAESSGYALYRGLIPMDILKAKLAPATQEKFFSFPRGEFRIYMAPNRHANIIITRDFVCYVITYKEDGKSKESWKSTVSADDVLKRLDETPGWDPELVDILRLIPEGSCIDWTLLWRDPQPQWASAGGRVVQLGDSAHSFLPTSGNGASQALEDALSLAVCLRLAGKGREQVATKVHNALRFERVSVIQKFGFANRRLMHHVDLDAAEKQPELIALTMPEWIWSHDPARYAIDNYAAAEAHVTKGERFQNTNGPPGLAYEPWDIASEMAKEPLLG
ncbi:FAD/NAD(P)-binding domain-containing protein [Hypoxylon sp. FL1150]|nr:FAD/NAD(P)-binding domain-containing protein [Hypoxylon sp. FL1150]